MNIQNEIYGFNKVRFQGFRGNCLKTSINGEETAKETVQVSPQETQKLKSSSEVIKFFEQNNCSSESFEKVFAEMKQNIPDRTSTTEEKEKAISYIDRMLVCKDISTELANYWQNKKAIIEQEIQQIKNEQKSEPEKVEDVWKELEDFVEKYKKAEPDNNLSKEDNKEYGLTYNRTCLSFYSRLLNCKNLTPELRAEYNNKTFEHLRDINYVLRDFSSEKFDDVYNEMKRNVPDRTTTLKEKMLAISYIDRMLACEDISPQMAVAWQSQRNVIEKEADSL